MKKAQNLNVQYFEGEQLLVASKFEEVINRIAYLEENKVKPISLEIATLVGAVSEPIVKISEAQTLYFDKIMAQREITLSDSKY